MNLHGDKVFFEGDSLEAINWIVQRELEPGGSLLEDVRTIRALMDEHSHWSRRWISHLRGGGLVVLGFG